MDRVTWGQIVLNTLNDETNQIAVCVDQYRNKEVTLWTEREMN
jgi:hypothetical protein